MHSFYAMLLNIAAILNSYLVVAEIPTFMGVSDNIVGDEHRKCAFAMHPMALKPKNKLLHFSIRYESVLLTVFI